MKSFITLIVGIVIILNAQEKSVTLIQPKKSLSFPTSALLNINRISAWYSSSRMGENSPASENPGLTYPQNTTTAIYGSGLMIGTIATDGIQSGPRITGCSYNSGFYAGAILGIKTGVTENPADTTVRIWRIRRDYSTADLLQDAASSYYLPIAAVNSSHISQLRRQYKKDWEEWPAKKGAPFYDSNNDGIYSPQFEINNGEESPKLFPFADEPGLKNADQVIWYVCNDLGYEQSAWKTMPLGIEEQVTIWGYKTTGVLENTIYKKFKLTYKGTAQTQDTARLTQMYIAHWSDPDLGDASDDFVGCDISLNAGFVYNSKTLDAEYRKFNIAPPSVGYGLLQGPIVKSSGDTALFDFKRVLGYKNLPMTSFVYFGGSFTDPPFAINGSIQWYQMMRGLPSIPEGPPDPAPLINPMTGLETRYWLSGDPVGKNGWLDKTPSDRRMLQSSGPFTMALGESQEIVIAVVGALGSDYLSSVSVFKFYMKKIRDDFQNLFPANVTFVDNVNGELPKGFSLTQNYPNPFNPATKIEFVLPRRTNVTLKIYDVIGREVAALLNEERSAGKYIVEWRGKNRFNRIVASGVYFYRLETGDFIQTKRMVLIK